MGRHVSNLNTFKLEAADEDDDSFPLAALDVGSTSSVSSANKPVAPISTLAAWLTNGFWTNQAALPHHWASNTITYNLGNLNAQEQALALSALKASSEVVNINFVQVSAGRTSTSTTTARCRR